MLTQAEFTTFQANWENFRVESVSSLCSNNGEIVKIKLVREFPPKDALRRWVSFESQYGIWELPSASFLMTWFNVNNEVLIDVVSETRSLEVSLSEPARSTMLSIEYLVFDLMWIFSSSSEIKSKLDYSFISIIILITACDLEENSFI